MIYIHKHRNALQDNNRSREVKYDVQLYFSTINLHYYDWMTPLDKYDHSNVCIEWLFLARALHSPGLSFSPVVFDEDVSELRTGVRVYCGHTAVHVNPQRNVVTLEDGRLNVHHVTQEVNTGWPLRLPVL